MPPARFELTIPASERPQTHSLDRAATGTGISIYWKMKYPFYRPFAAPLVSTARGRHTIRLTLATPLVFISRKLIQ
jgi:hypothetical protein